MIKPYLNKRPKLKKKVLLIRDTLHRIPPLSTIKKIGIKKKAKQYSKKYPQELLIENTNYCNAKCIMCPNPKMARPKGYMNMELFKKIIDEYSNFGGRIQITATGEPLLDKDIIEKIRYATSKPKIKKVHLSTNGALLNEEIAKQLVTSGINRINVSIDGVDKEEYEKVRKGLIFEKVIKNTIRLIDLRNELRPNLFINIGLMVTQPVKEAEKSWIIQKFRKLGANVEISSIKEAHDWAGVVEIDNPDYYINKKRRTLCKRIWESLSIAWDGRVFLCCLDYEGKVILGDLKEETIGQVWFGKRLKAIRQLHMKNKQYRIPLCKNCSEKHYW